MRLRLPDDGGAFTPYVRHAVRRNDVEDRAEEAERRRGLLPRLIRRPHGGDLRRRHCTTCSDGRICWNLAVFERYQCLADDDTTGAMVAGRATVKRNRTRRRGKARVLARRIR